MSKRTIRSVRGREILDSRGNPTVEAVVTLEDGCAGRAAVPSGASTGKHEAKELRDENMARFGGKGVLLAVENINSTIHKGLQGVNAACACTVDKKLEELDGTEDFSNIGANAALAVSLACARAASTSYSIPLYRHLGGICANTMPVPMMNILNGGAHANNNVDIQEFMIMPVVAVSFSQAMEWCCQVYHCLGRLLKERRLSTAVGDEGGFAPNLADDEEAIRLVLEAVERCGFHPYQDFVLALDAAASQWHTEQGYTLPKKQVAYTTQELIAYWEQLAAKYPIQSLEDPLDEDDWQGFVQLTHRLGSRVQIVGDDLFVTSSQRVRQGAAMEAANAVLIKPNQAGTLSKTLEAAAAAGKSNFGRILSHRSGETEDTIIADLAVAINAGQIKTGAPCRSERVAKYNQLLRIEAALGDSAKYPGKGCFPFPAPLV